MVVMAKSKTTALDVSLLASTALAFAGQLIVLEPAAAQSARAPYNWTGCYIGGHGRWHDHK